ncbi:hypothetical protein VaNZ11_012671 [Volvox africanus]|uniref:Uncharacterized protein n=1 Tax=Volvox africanus TaxID=51714 RepID=A0ABQ5SEF9_9CHLO|nr:hypothetical protein VaNZ11_012671 [Volvox africanus]
MGSNAVWECVLTKPLRLASLFTSWTSNLVSPTPSATHFPSSCATPSYLAADHGTCKAIMAHARRSWHMQSDHGTCKAIMAHAKRSNRSCKHRGSKQGNLHPLHLPTTTGGNPRSQVPDSSVQTPIQCDGEILPAFVSTTQLPPLVLAPVVQDMWSRNHLVHRATR